MERQILYWSYWLGIAGLIVAVLWKAVTILGIPLPWSQFNLALTFYKGSLLLLVAAIASANHSLLESQKP